MNDATTLARRFLREMATDIALGYAWISLVPSWRAGVLLAALTWLQPSVGAVGLLAALCAWGAAYLAGAGPQERPVSVFNGLLSGLFVANLWVSGVGVIALAILGGIFAGWLSVVLGRLSWTLIRLPVLSLPFALVGMLIGATGASLSTLKLNPYVASTAVFDGNIDHFLNAFGSLYFMGNPIVGALIICVLLAFSRYYLLLAILGYGTAVLCMQLLGAVPEHLAATGWRSNAILAALLVGGLFATPSKVTAALALLAAVFAAWLSLSLGRIFQYAQISAFSMPFVIGAWLVLYAAVHNTRIAARFNVHQPDFPERSYERSQITQARIGETGSIPLALPFRGTWTVSQGFSGAHTHRGLWRHALDFIVVKAGKSYTNRGSTLEDFYCYNLPVLCPAYGQVWSVVDHIADNAPGTVNVVDNWGNYVIVRLANGQFVLVAHLKPHSIVVHAGIWVKPGDLLGHCGNSGRSPQPHIHMHLQTRAEPGSPTAPFHLASVMLTPADGQTRYELAIVPPENTQLSPAIEGDARPLYLFAGRGLRYTVARNGHASQEWSIHCEIDALGCTQIVSSHGGRCSAESTWAVFSCYERDAVADPFLDLWLLGCGYTPASTQVTQWDDHCVPARMLPNTGARWLANLAWPMAAFAQSHYQRQWDTQAQGWRQQAQHRQNLSGLSTQVHALLMPQLGCAALSATVGKEHYIFQATNAFQRADLGIPGWDVKLHINTNAMPHAG